MEIINLFWAIIYGFNQSEYFGDRVSGCHWKCKIDVALHQAEQFLTYTA